MQRKNAAINLRPEEELADLLWQVGCLCAKHEARMKLKYDRLTELLAIVPPQVALDISARINAEQEQLSKPTPIPV